MIAGSYGKIEQLRHNGRALGINQFSCVLPSCVRECARETETKRSHDIFFARVTDITLETICNTETLKNQNTENLQTGLKCAYVKRGSTFNATHN